MLMATARRELPERWAPLGRAAADDMHAYYFGFRLPLP